MLEGNPEAPRHELRKQARMLNFTDKMSILTTVELKTDTQPRGPRDAKTVSKNMNYFLTLVLIHLYAFVG